MVLLSLEVPSGTMIPWTMWDLQRLTGSIVSRFVRYNQVTVEARRPPRSATYSATGGFWSGRHGVADLYSSFCQQRRSYADHRLAPGAAPETTLVVVLGDTSMAQCNVERVRTDHLSSRCLVAGFHSCRPQVLWSSAADHPKSRLLFHSMTMGCQNPGITQDWRV